MAVGLAGATGAAVLGARVLVGLAGGGCGCEEVTVGSGVTVNGSGVTVTGT